MREYPRRYDIAAGTPLLVLACSATKRSVGDELIRFHDLYDGPMWRQVRASSFPLSNVAAISALYGFLEPGAPIRTYDMKMDEKRSRCICQTSNHVALFADAVEQAGSAFIVGGVQYRELANTAIRWRASLQSKLTFASGSFLKQRKQLSEFLKSNQHGD